jgi:hypothetical protein
MGSSYTVNKTTNDQGFNMEQFFRYDPFVQAGGPTKDLEQQLRGSNMAQTMRFRDDQINIILWSRTFFNYTKDLYINETL